MLRHDTLLLSSVGAMVVLAAVMVPLLKRAYIPAIVTYLGVGLLTEPLLRFLFPLLTGAENVRGLPATIELMGDIGIALLLFIVGLELSLEKIRGVGPVALYAGIGQVIFTAVGGFILCFALDFSTVEAIFLATALTFSSTVVVVKLLDQKKELDSLYGRIAVGIFLVQDLVVILALTFLSGLGSPQVLSPLTLTWNMTKAFLGMGVLLVFSVLASRYLLVKPFNWAARSPGTIFIWSLGWCFSYVVWAEAMHLSPELGAFLAGVSLAQLESSQDLRRRIHPLMDFFVAVFFISLGARMPLAAASQYWAAASVLSLFVLVGNPFIFLWIIARCGYSERVSFLTSVTVAQISEFSFIFAAVGLQNRLIQESILSLIALIGFVTIVVSSYMIVFNHELYAWARQRKLLNFFRASSDASDEGPPTERGHVIVVGLNTMGKKIATRLVEEGQVVVCIDRDPLKLQGVPGRKILGSMEYSSVTEEARLGDARLAVSALRIEDLNTVLALRCRALGVSTAIHATDSSVVEELKRLKVEFIIDSKRSGVGAMIDEIKRRGGWGHD